MTRQEFELHIAQVETVIKNCRCNFKSKQHQEIYNNLISLFQAVKTKYTNFDKLNLEFCNKFVLRKICLDVEFLHYEKKRDIPIHLISCLDLCLNDWIDNPDFFSITFSEKGIFFQEFMTLTYQDVLLNEINNWTRVYLNNEYTHGLIQICQPRFFNHDFLSNIPCYHELGHFIENTYSVAFWIIKNKDFEYVTPTFTLRSRNKDEQSQLIHYLKEHFCDLFAVQYLGKVLSENLNFVAENHDYGTEHPSTMRRIAVIETFLSNSGDPNDLLIVSLLKEATKVQTRRRKLERELTDRRITLSTNLFLINKPVKLSIKNGIHNLIIKGWEHFMNSSDYTDPTARNEHVNNLIQKSIIWTLTSGNYYSPKNILSRWRN
jgi:hypothetical protein